MDDIDRRWSDLPKIPESGGLELSLRFPVTIPAVGVITAVDEKLGFAVEEEEEG